MSTSKKFSELPAASSVGNGDLFAIAHEDALAETGYVSQKLTAAQAGQKVNGDTEYPTSLPSFPANGQNPFAALEKLNQDIIDLYPVNTASGSIANFTTSLAKPLTALSSTIVAQQAGTGTPSPSNPRSISGFSSVSFFQRGVNLWDEQTESGTYNWTTGEDYPNTDFFRTANYIKVLPSTNYTLVNPTKSTTYLRVAYYDKNGVFISATGYLNGTTTITTPNTCNYVKFAVAKNVYGSTYANDISLNSSSDTEYHAYNAETKTIALGQTVYGGVLDAKNGKLRITWGIVTDWSNLRVINNQTGTNTYECIVHEIPKKAGVSNIISNEFETKAYTDDGNYGMRGYGSSSGVAFRFPISEVSTLADAKAFLINNNVVLVYELATPTEITGLTPANFTTIAGENNIFSDCGDISVSFKQGIQEYIDAKIAETQALIL